LELRQYYSRTSNSLFEGVELHKVDDLVGVFTLDNVVPERVCAAASQDIGKVVAPLDAGRLWLASSNALLSLLC
jgi:hypothetical protein